MQQLAPVPFTDLFQKVGDIGFVQRFKQLDQPLLAADLDRGEDCVHGCRVQRIAVGFLSFRFGRYRLIEIGHSGTSI